MAHEDLKTDGAEDGRGHAGRTGIGAQDTGAQESRDAGEADSDDSPEDYSAASQAAYKAGVANLIAGVGGTLASAIIISGAVAVGFAAGYIVGAVNILWLFKIATKGINMAPQKAGRYVASSYYLRYAITILALGALIATRLVKAWPAVAGLTVCIFTTIAAMIFAVREEVY
ncbi:MAG: ATP synthase subunit I [Deltaproteobacteria bacterium]